MSEEHDYTDIETLAGLYDCVRDLRAERDRLRAVVERAHDHVGLDEHVLRTLAVDDLVALVSVLRHDYAEADAEVCRLEAERDRLLDIANPDRGGHVSDDYVDTLAPERDRLREDRDDWRNIADDAIAELADTRAERDRLRTVVFDTLAWLRQMTGLACAVDVLHVADLYRTVTDQLDVSPTIGVKQSDAD